MNFQEFVTFEDNFDTIFNVIVTNGFNFRLSFYTIEEAAETTAKYIVEKYEKDYVDELIRNEDIEKILRHVEEYCCDEEEKYEYYMNPPKWSKDYKDFESFEDDAEVWVSEEILD